MRITEENLLQKGYVKNNHGVFWRSFESHLLELHPIGKVNFHPRIIEYPIAPGLKENKIFIRKIMLIEDLENLEDLLI